MTVGHNGINAIHDGQAVWEPPAEEPDNPAAWALARHIADHPISTVQAAFRYLNAPLTIELHDDPAAAPAGPAPDTDRETQRERIVDALLTTSRADYPYRSGHEKWDHHKHGDRPGHSYAISCALCTGDVDALADAVLAVVPAPDNRAAVLLWAADQIDAGWFTTAATATAELRRLAGEVQQDEERGICTCAAAGVTLLPPGHYGDCPECPREVQQDPTQDGEEAHPPQHAWRVETRDPLANEWAPGSHFPRRQAAVERYETANRTAPLWRDGTPVERRIVRETTTYTVEEPTAVARPGQPETETSP